MVKKMWLWHPDSPGMRVLVVRGWLGRLFKPRDFATLGEAAKASRHRSAIWPPPEPQQGDGGGE